MNKKISELEVEVKRVKVGTCVRQLRLTRKRRFDFDSRVTHYA